jgi:hypothetical protein
MENTSIAKDPAHTELVEQLMARWRRGWQGAQPIVQPSAKTNS